METENLLKESAAMQALFDLFIRPLLNADLTGQLQARTTSYDDLFTHEDDGTARYDDVWGAPCVLEHDGD